MTTLLWLLYFVLPSHDGLHPGLPLGRFETVGVVLVIWIAAHRVRVAGAWPAALLAAAATAASLAVPGERGLNARYYATAAASGAPERSTDFGEPGFTRIDRRLDFARGRHDFPLGFINDHTRFNFIQAGEPDRRYLEFAAAWTGWWYSPGGQHTIYVRAPQATAQVAVDAAPLITTTVDNSERTHDVQLSEGWHRLHVTFSSPYGAPRVFSAGELAGGAHRPFDVMSTRTERVDGVQRVVSETLRIVTRTADTLAIAWLSAIAALLLVRRVGELWQQRVAAWPAAIAVWMALATAEALRFAWPWAERLRIMVAGDDTMVYEGYARDILFNGILMNRGQPPGTGEPFYFQAFYPYFLAASHAIFGESFFGALFLQRVLVAATAVIVTRLAMRIWNAALWPVGLVLSASFLYWKLAPISADLLSESLYVPVLAASTLALVECCQTPLPRRAIAAGLLCGVAAITRSTSLLSWVAIWPMVWWSGRPYRSGVRSMAWVMGCTLAVFSLVAVRNAIVSHRFVASPTGFAVTLRGGNEPPPDVMSHSAPRQKLYRALNVGGETAEVVEYALTAPGPFWRNMGRKALFVLGWYEPYAPGWGYSPVYIAVWAGAVGGMFALVRRRSIAPAALLPFIVAVTQYAAIVIVYPKGERLVVPIHTMLLPYAVIAAHLTLTRLGLFARAIPERSMPTPS